MKLERIVFGYPIRAEVNRLDAGWDIGIYGGCGTHVGAVTLAEGDGICRTLEREHHKDSFVSELWATELAKKLNEPVCVRCGIHYDNASKDQLSAILHCCDELLQEAIINLKEVWKMHDSLKFPIESCTHEQYQDFNVCTWKDIPYCGAPVDDIQRLNLYAPACYFAGGSINGYTLKSAPIFLPNWVGGYMPGPSPEPRIDENGNPNEVLSALMHGYVVACAGIRGRTTANNHGKAPALIVDMKAAIRYLRHNRDVIPGDTEKMITSGTSAGGALSALAGTSGNASAYEPWLQQIGAAQERDDVFAANCYCPIINLDHADAAYEWQFSQERYYRSWHGDGNLTDEQLELAKLLKDQFPTYLNSLCLRDGQGDALTLEHDGSGSFLEYVKQAVVRSAQAELDAPQYYKRAVPGSEVSKQPFLTIQNGKVENLDWNGFVHAITRMKQPPAFDNLTLTSPENDVFAGADGAPRHFTSFAQKQTGGRMADAEIIKLLNPMEQIHSSGCAKHWRIRHGAYDRDTSLAISTMFALALRMRGCQVDFQLPWGIPHSGNYDLPELFAWIDKLCK